MEMKFMQHIFGAGGTSYLKEKWSSSCLATAEKPLLVKDALLASEALKKTKLWRCLGLQAQGAVSSAHDML
eukprot:2145619-Amphidinium_carterae.1